MGQNGPCGALPDSLYEGVFSGASQQLTGCSKTLTMKRIIVRSTIVFTAAMVFLMCASADQPATPENVQGAWIYEPDSATNYTRVTWELSPDATGYNVFRFN